MVLVDLRGGSPRFFVRFSIFFFVGFSGFGFVRRVFVGISLYFVVYGFGLVLSEFRGYFGMSV